MAYRSAPQPEWWHKLKLFDAFPKQREEAAEFFTRTTSGGIITLVATFFMTILFFSELGELVFLVASMSANALCIASSHRPRHLPCLPTSLTR